jgi:lipopolysaccharide export system permease protein
MGLLTATLLVFGRFSADQELTAARASGVSLVSLITPILLISLLCCGISAEINMELGPQSRVAYKNLLFHARSEMNSVQLPEDTYIRDFPGYLCWVGKNRDGYLQDIQVAKFDTNYPNPEFISAPRGKLEIDPENHVMHLYLTNMVSSQMVGIHERLGSYQAFILDIKTPTNQVYQPKISDMSFGQLRQEMHNEENLLHLSPARGATPADLRAQLRQYRQQKNDWTLPVRVEMNRQIAFSFASFGFALVGIPLGIRMHRRETNIGIAIALGLAVLYYSFIILGESLSTRAEFYPHLILWLPNFIFQAVGGVLLWRANRGF